MPVTVHPGQDLHLVRGRALGELRAELAACAGRPELLRSPLYVDDRRLDDHHVVGHPPLVAGAVLRTSPASCPTPDLALASPVHLAVLTGPGTGDLLPLGVPEEITAFGLRLRARPRRGGVRITVREDGSNVHSLVTLTSPAGRVRTVTRSGRRQPQASARSGAWALRWVTMLPRPQLRPRWRRWRDGHLLTVQDHPVRAPTARAPSVHGPSASAVGGAQTTVELREQPVLMEQTYASILAGLAEDGRGERTMADGSRPSTAMLVTALVPALGAIVLAVVLRNPLFALMAITGPLMILGPLLSRSRRARAASSRGMRGSSPAPSPSPAPTTASASAWRTPWGPAALRAGVPAADLLTAAAACGALPTAVSAGVGPRPALSSGAETPSSSRPGELPDGCLAVIGPHGPAAALAARMVISLHATGRGNEVTILCDQSRWPLWSWVRWLPHSAVLSPAADLALASGPGRLLVVDSASLPDLAPRLGAWHAELPEQSAMLLLVPDGTQVPSWCSARAEVEAGPGGWGARTTWSAPGTAVEITPFDGVTTTWLEAYARRVAALYQRGRWTHLSRGVESGVGQTTVPRQPHGSEGAGLPRRAALVDAPGIWETERRWRENTQPHGPPSRRAQDLGEGPGNGSTNREGETLRADLGLGSGGVVASVDLLRDGPHALVAGTTGSGKSELLQTLILTLALTYSPAELAVALVDYKGGASFGACARLPHVVGQVTDLDPGAAERALTGLRAELRRREQLFAQVGATDLAAYRARLRADFAPQVPGDAEPLPRLLIVVDEFRALAEDHPDFIPGLVRIAAQGRSLGIHLVLATQRPGGAITADMRANISLRIALRVSSDGDSRDVIDAPDAAHIPADLPGRAVVRRGSGAPEALQTYLVGGSPSVPGPAVWHSPDPGRAEERSPSGRFPRRPLARTDGMLEDDRAPFDEVDAANAEGARGAAGHREVQGDVRTNPADALVARAVDVADRLSIASPRVPWTPALPTQLVWEDLPAPSTGSGTITLGLADHPRDQVHRPVGWDLAEGHLLVLGRAGSGRTTTLRTVARAAMAAGKTVHLLGPADLAAGFDPSSARLGTCATRTDVRRVARLLTLLTGSAPADGGDGYPGTRGAAAPEELPGSTEPSQHLVIVDGLEDFLTSLGALHRGGGVDLFLSALREGPAHGTAFALSGGVLPSSNLAALIRHRLTLASSDKHDDAFLGIPAPLAGLGGSPGRAVLATANGPVLCQVARAAHGDLSRLSGLSGLTAPPVVGGSPGRLRIEVVPFPVRATGILPSSSGPGPGWLLLGRGGDGAGALWVPPARSMLVCGPHGSGRTGTLHQLLTAPMESPDPHESILGVVTRDPLLAERARALGAVPTLTRLTAGPAAQFVEDVTDRLKSRPARSRQPRRLVIDDLDVFSAACPAAMDALWALVADQETGPPAAADGPVPVALLASATTLAASGAFRGALAELRAARFGVVLAPGTPGSTEVFGTDVAWQVEPGVRHPGRGALVDGSSATFVQVAYAQ